MRLNKRIKFIKFIMEIVQDLFNIARNIEQVLAATPHKAPTIRSPTTYHDNYTS